mmetsp:Transcript_21771/g.33834  ORF Transcript_21771/g.33834 Transcript_21771/m.33834 type:complete len:306 (-) Transcript_21771:28-945(-)
MLHYIRGLNHNRTHPALCASQMSCFSQMECSLRSFLQSSPQPVRNTNDGQLMTTSKMRFGRGGGPGAGPRGGIVRDFSRGGGQGSFGRGGVSQPPMTSDEAPPNRDFNRFNNDSRLLLEIVQKFPIDADGNIKPLQVPHLMASLHEDAQEALGNKGGLLKFLQDRGQLFIVKRAPVEGKKDVMAYFCIITKVAARIGAQRKEQIDELREGKMEMAQSSFAATAAARGGFSRGGFGRGAPPSGGFARGGGFGRGSAPQQGRGGFSQGGFSRGGSGFSGGGFARAGGPGSSHGGRFEGAQGGRFAKF